MNLLFTSVVLWNKRQFGNTCDFMVAQWGFNRESHDRILYPISSMHMYIHRLTWVLRDSLFNPRLEVDVNHVG